MDCFVALAPRNDGHYWHVSKHEAQIASSVPKGPQMSQFFQELFEYYSAWRDFPLLQRQGDGWNGLAICVSPPLGSDLAGEGLDIEEVGGEVTICLDYSHIHMMWPPKTNGALEEIWCRPFAMIDAILGEAVVATSGWIDGELRIATIHKVNEIPNLILPGLQHVRMRSWKGTYNRDEVLS